MLSREAGDQKVRGDEAGVPNIVETTSSIALLSFF
jgi:hypothetical protein